MLQLLPVGDAKHPLTGVLDYGKSGFSWPHVHCWVSFGVLSKHC